MTLSLALLLKALWTGLAGAVGAGTRHTIATMTRQTFGDSFPWGTLAINLSGALIIGFVSALLARHLAPSSWHALIILGFLGGYTTFSSFMLEIAHLRQRQAHFRAIAYLAASLLLGPLAAFVGLALGGLVA